MTNKYLGTFTPVLKGIISPLNISDLGSFKMEGKKIDLFQ